MDKTKTTAVPRSPGRITPVFLYIGCGLATQALSCGDMTFRTLASPDATVSTWAHILAWPLFLLILCGYYVLWMLAAIIVGVLVVAYLCFDDWRSRRARVKLRQGRV